MALSGASRPGEVNAHTHLYSGLAPLGMPSPKVPPANFVQILEQVWWRLDRALDAQSLRASARLYLAEALLAGTTTVIDHHESPGLIEGSLDILADAAMELGIRLLVTYGATERNGGRNEARRGLAECKRFIQENRRPLVRGLIGLHASFTVSDETIREAGALARGLGAVVHVHVAEDGADVVDAKKRGFVGPLERLLSLEGLPPGSVVAHGVHLDEAQVARARLAGLWLVQNPRSNEANRVGYAQNLWKSDQVALGTDGFPSDLAVERAALGRLARANGGREDLAQLPRRETAGRELVAAHFTNAADVVDGRDVTIDGAIVVKDGRLARADLDEIRAHAREQAALLFRRMEALP